MERMVSATEARIHLGELMRRVVESQEPIIIQRGGKPHLILLSIAQYERLLKARQQEEDWRDLVRQARAQIQADLGGRELPPSEEILRQTRENRDEQLVAVH